VKGAKGAVIVAKNTGASKRAALFAKRLNTDFALIFGEQTKFADLLSEEMLTSDGSAQAAMVL
jgi:phosphoribosylpyrophosphate synthetase